MAVVAAVRRISPVLAKCGTKHARLPLGIETERLGVVHGGMFCCGMDAVVLTVSLLFLCSFCFAFSKITPVRFKVRRNVTRVVVVGLCGEHSR